MRSQLYRDGIAASYCATPGARAGMRTKSGTRNHHNHHNSRTCHALALRTMPIDTMFVSCRAGSLTPQSERNTLILFDGR